MEYDGLSDRRCSIFPENPDYCLVLGCVRIVVSVISCIGCLVTIFLIWLLQKFRSFTQRMVLHLAFASFLAGISYLMEGLYVESGPVCQIQAFLLTATAWQIMLWMLAITINVFILVVWEKSLLNYERYVGAGCWGGPLVVAALPWADDQYNPAGVWCWARAWGWRFGIWYIEAFLSVLFIFGITIYSSVALRRKNRRERTSATIERLKSAEDDINRLRVYPVAYLIVMLFPTINRLQNAVSHDNYVFGLLLLQTLTGPLLGAVNALIFGIDKETIKDLKELKAAGLRNAIEARFRNPLKRKRGGTIKEYSPSKAKQRETPGIDNQAVEL